MNIVTYRHAHTYIHMHICAHTHTETDMKTHTYMCTHAHTHTHRDRHTTNPAFQRLCGFRFSSYQAGITCRNVAVPGRDNLQECSSTRQG